MCYYRFTCVLLVVIASRVDGDSRSSKSTISHHQSASSDESFTPLALFGGNLFPADVPTDEQVFAPTLPLPEKQVLELGNLRTDIEATSVSSRNGGSSRSQAQSDVEHHPAAQKIYPTFFRNIPPLGHSRPYYQSTEAAIEQRFNKLRTGVPTAPEIASPLLGSGDFGIIKGGTFYYDTDVPGKGFVDDFYGLGYSGNNGHGRPQLAYLVQKPQKEEQFSNFRDFADINISNDPAYSHHVPLYLGMHDADGARKPPPPGIPSSLAPATVPETTSTAGAVKREPDNILDELRSLDEPPQPNGKSRPRMHEGKAKKETLYERKKRPKATKNVTKGAAAEQSEGEDYMVASS
ncbi:uncharacterized protein LOC126558937 [Anopheles maculipalpis]|uniref:uncharacterized protein LOC126558937 n=1 Tax=Anopheles maculipalpis TaxID=1496333 RepID=UPI00215918D7|nr:uncharacterized protein LOC126558937 [Anopheles maculipalpis]